MRVEEVTLDDPQDHEMLVKLAAAGTCHSDLHFMKGDIPVPTPETHPTSNLISHPVFSPKLQSWRVLSITSPPFHTLECRPKIC